MGKLSIAEKAWAERFSKNLKRAIEDSDMSQAEIARKTGLGQGTISRYLTGDRSPKAYHITELSKVLGVSTDDLIDDNPYF